MLPINLVCFDTEVLFNTFVGLSRIYWSLT